MIRASSQKNFKWSRRQTWARTMLKLLADKLNDAVLTEIQKRNPLYLRDDRFAWLNESVATIHNIPLEDIPDLLGARLSEFYHGVVAFHGCRPASLAGYENNGLMPSDTEALRAYALELFSGTQVVAEAIADIGGSYVGHNRGRIWLCLTKEAFFLNGHDGYLRHGSEFLSAIANRVNQQDKLRAIGVPTIIECVLRKAQMPEDFWPGLSRAMIEDWFTRFLRPEESQRACTYCVDVRTQIPPDHIIEFHQYDEVKSAYSWCHLQTGEKLKGESIKFRRRQLSAQVG
jgi:hypothetical protein